MVNTKRVLTVTIPNYYSLLKQEKKLIILPQSYIIENNKNHVNNLIRNLPGRRIPKA
jgi:hypothetical protein